MVCIVKENFVYRRVGFQGHVEWSQGQPHGRDVDATGLANAQRRWCPPLLERISRMGGSHIQAHFAKRYTVSNMASHVNCLLFIIS